MGSKSEGLETYTDQVLLDKVGLSVSDWVIENAWQDILMRL